MPVAHGCREILVVAGRLVLTGELTQTGHSAALAASLAAVRPVDATLVFLAEEKPRSAVGAAFVHGQPFSDQMVLVPWEVERWGVDGRRLVDDAEAVEKLADLYRVQVQVPVGSARSARLVPVDPQGRETSWDDAVAVRSLPWSHVAAREAVRTAVEIASDRTSPSWTRIEALAGWLAESHQRLRVPVPTAAVAMAFRLVRHGLPPGPDAAELMRKVMPVSMADVLSVAGGEPTPTADVDALLDGLLRAPDSSALVRLRPGLGAGELGWLVTHDDVVWWFGASPAPGGGPGPVIVPVGEGWVSAALRDPATAVVVFGPVQQAHRTLLGITVAHPDEHLELDASPPDPAEGPVAVDSGPPAVLMPGEFPLLVDRVAIEAPPAVEEETDTAGTDASERLAARAGPPDRIAASAADLVDVHAPDLRNTDWEVVAPAGRATSQRGSLRALLDVRALSRWARSGLLDSGVLLRPAGATELPESGIRLVVRAEPADVYRHEKAEGAAQWYQAPLLVTVSWRHAGQEWAVARPAVRAALMRLRALVSDDVLSGPGSRASRGRAELVAASQGLATTAARLGLTVVALPAAAIGGRQARVRAIDPVSVRTLHDAVVAQVTAGRWHSAGPYLTGNGADALHQVLSGPGMTGLLPDALDSQGATVGPVRVRMAMFHAVPLGEIGTDDTTNRRVRVGLLVQVNLMQQRHLPHLVFRLDGALELVLDETTANQLLHAVSTPQGEPPDYQPPPDYEPLAQGASPPASGEPTDGARWLRLLGDMGRAGVDEARIRQWIRLIDGVPDLDEVSALATEALTAHVEADLMAARTALTQTDAVLTSVRATHAGLKQAEIEARRAPENVQESAAEVTARSTRVAELRRAAEAAKVREHATQERIESLKIEVARRDGELRRVSEDPAGVAQRGLVSQVRRAWYAVAVDLGVPPRSLRIVGAELAAVVRTRGTDAGTDGVLTGLRPRLRPFGVFTDTDVVYLADLGTRLRLGPQDLPSFRWLNERAVALELIHTLPDNLATRTLAWAADQVRRGHDLAAVAAELGLLPGLGGSRTTARELRVSTLRTLADRLDLGPATDTDTDTDTDTEDEPPAAPPSDGSERPSLLTPDRLPAKGEVDLAGLLAVRELIQTATRAVAETWRDAIGPADATTFGDRVADEIERIAAPHGFKDLQHLTRYAELSGRLGFPVTELSIRMPSRHLASLVYQFIGNVPYRLINRFLAEVAPGQPIDDPTDIRPDHTPWTIDTSTRRSAAWAHHWGVPEAEVRRIADLPLVDLPRTAATIDKLRLPREQITRLLHLTHRTGRTQDRLEWVAYRAGVTPHTALEWAWRLDTDPSDLLPLRATLHRLGELAPPARAAHRLTVERLVDQMRRPNDKTLPKPEWLFFWVGAHLPGGSGSDGLTPNELYSLLYGPPLDGRANLRQHHRQLLREDWIGLTELADDSALPLDGDGGSSTRPALPAGREADLWLTSWLADMVGSSREAIVGDLLKRPWLDHIAVLDAAEDLAVPVTTAMDYARRWGRLSVSDAPRLPPNTHPAVLPWLLSTAVRWKVPLFQLGPVVAALPGQQDPGAYAQALADNALRQLWGGRTSDVGAHSTVFGDARLSLAFLTDRGLTPADRQADEDEYEFGLWLTSVLGLPQPHGIDLGSTVGTLSSSGIDQVAAVRHLWQSLKGPGRENYLRMLSEVAEALGLDLHRRHALSTRLRISAWWITAFSVRIERIPDDIDDHAVRLGVPPDKLFALASHLGIDPATIHPPDDLDRLRTDTTPRFAAVRDVANAIRNRPDWPTRRLIDTPTDHLFDIVRRLGHLPPRLTRQLNGDGRWLGLRSQLEIAATERVPPQSVALWANLSRPPGRTETGQADSRQLVDGYQRWRRATEETYGLDASDLWTVWNHAGSAPLTRGDVDQVRAMALRHAEPARRAEVFRRISAHAGRQDTPQNVAGVIRAMSTTAGSQSSLREWLNPFLADAPPIDGISLRLQWRPRAGSALPDATFARLGAIPGVQVAPRRNAATLTFGPRRGTWTGLAHLLAVLREPHLDLVLATVYVTPGYGSDAGAYLRLAHLYYAHLNALSQIGVADGSGPEARHGFASFAGFLRAHSRGRDLRIRVAWKSDDVVQLRMANDADLLQPGTAQARLRIIAELVEIARRPFPHPQWWDWRFRLPGDHADDAFELGLDGWRLVGLLADDTTRAQAAAMLTIFPAKRIDADEVIARGLGPVLDDPTIPDVLPPVRKVPETSLLVEILAAGDSTRELDPTTVTARLTDPILGMNYRAAVLRAAGVHEVFAAGRVPGDQRVSDVIRQLIAGQLRLPDDVIRAAYYTVSQAPDTTDDLRKLLQRDRWDDLASNWSTVDAFMDRPRVWRDTAAVTSETNVSDAHDDWPEPPEVVDWLRRRIDAGVPPVPDLSSNVLGGPAAPESARTFALTIEAAWDDDLPGKPWTWVSFDERRDAFDDALAAAESALPADGRRTHLRTEIDPGYPEWLTIRATDLVDSPAVWRALGAVVEAMRRYSVSVTEMAIVVDYSPPATSGSSRSVEDRTAVLDRLVRAHEDVLVRLFGRPDSPTLTLTRPPEVTAVEPERLAAEVSFDRPGVLSAGLGGLQAGVRVVWALVAAAERAVPTRAASPVGTSFATTSELYPTGSWYLDPSGGSQLVSLLADLELDRAGRAQVAALFHLNSWPPPPDHSPGPPRGTAHLGDRPSKIRGEHPAAFVAAVARIDPQMAARDAVSDRRALGLPLDYLHGIQRRADEYLRLAPPTSDVTDKLEFRYNSVVVLWADLERSGATIGAWRERYQREQRGSDDLSADESQGGPIPGLLEEVRGLLDTIPTTGSAVAEDVATLRVATSWLTSPEDLPDGPASRRQLDLLRQEVSDRLVAVAPDLFRAAPVSMAARQGQWAHRGLLGAVLEAATWQGVPLPPEIHTPGHLRDFVVGQVTTYPERFTDVAGGRGALLADEMPFNILTALLAGFRAAEPTPEQLDRWHAAAVVAARRRLPDADEHTIQAAALAASGARRREHLRSRWREEFARRAEQPTTAFKSLLLRTTQVRGGSGGHQLTQLIMDGSTTGVRHLIQGVEQDDLQMTALARHVPTVVARALNINIVIHSDQIPVEQTHPGDRPVLHLSRIDRLRGNHLDKYRPYGPLVSAEAASSTQARTADTMDPILWAFAHAWAHERHLSLAGGHGPAEQEATWVQLVEVLARWIDIPPMKTKVVISPDGDRAVFGPAPWAMQLTVRTVDGALSELMQQLLLAEVVLMQAQSKPTSRLADYTSNAAARAHISRRRSMQDSRLGSWPDDYHSTRTMWAGVEPAARDLLLKASRRSAILGPLEQSPRLRRRLVQGLNAARWQYASAMAYTDHLDPVVWTQFLLRQQLAKAGSTRDWRNVPYTRGSETPGFELVELGSAGHFRRPTGSRTTPPTRLTHQLRRLEVVEAGDPVSAPHVLTKILDGLPDQALVELIMSGPVTARQAVDLARMVGGGRTLALAADLVDPADLSEHFVAFSRSHRPTLRPFAAYYTVHTAPRRDTVRIADVDLHDLGAGTYELLPGWHVTVGADRLWIRPSAHREALSYSGNARLIVGLPGRATPWTVERLARRIGTAIALDTGNDPEGFVHLLGRIGPMPRKPHPTEHVLNPSSAQDRQLLWDAFGVPDPNVRIDLTTPHGSAPPEKALTFAHLVDVLLDLAGADPTVNDPSVLVGELDQLAVRLGMLEDGTVPGAVLAARQRLLSWAHLRASAVGIAGLLAGTTPPGATTASRPDEHVELDASPPSPAEEPVAVGSWPPAVLTPDEFPLVVEDLVISSEPEPEPDAEDAAEDAADEAPSDPMDIDTSPEADETASDSMAVDALSEPDEAPTERVAGLAANLVKDHAKHLQDADWRAVTYDTAVTSQRVVLRDLLSAEQLTAWRKSGLFDSGVVLRPARVSRPEDRGIRLVVRAEPVGAYQHVGAAESAQWYAAPLLVTVRWEHSGHPPTADLPVVRAALVQLRALVSDEVLSGPGSRVARRGAELVGVDEKLAATVDRLNPVVLDLPPETLRRGLARVAAIDPVSVRTLHDAVVAEVEVGRWRSAGRQLMRADTLHQVVSGPGLSGMLGAALRPQGATAGPLRFRMALVDALPLGTLSSDDVVYQRVRGGLLVQVEPAEVRGLPQLVFRLDGALELALDTPTADRFRQETPPPAYQRVWEPDEPVSEASPTVPAVTPAVDQQPQTDDLFHGDAWTRLVSDLGVTGPDEARTRQWVRLIESVPDPDEVTDLTVEAISAVHGPLPTDAQERASADLVEPLRRAWYAVAQDLGLPPGALRIVGRELVTVVRTRATNTRVATADELLTGLRERLGPFGVSTDVEVVYLAELSARLGLGPDDLPSFRWLSERGVPLELVHTLPDRLAGRSVAWAADQVRRGDDIAGVAKELGMFLVSVGPDESVRKVRRKLRLLALEALAGQLSLGPVAPSGTESEHPAPPDAPPVDAAGDPPSARLETAGRIDLAGLLSIREMIRTAAGIVDMRADRVRPAEVGTLVERLVDQVRLIAEELGFKSLQHVTRYAELSGKLGFPVTELSNLLPSGHLPSLVYQLVGNVPTSQITRFLTEVAPARLIRQSADLEPDLMPASTSTRLSVREAAGWADRWEVPEEQVRAVAELPLVDLPRVARLVDKLHLPKEQIARLLDVIADTGHVPDRLDWFAYRAGIEPEVALELSWRLNANILDLLPMRSVLNRLAVHTPERSDDRLTVEHLVRLLTQGPDGEPVPFPSWTFWVGARLPNGSGADGLTPNELHDLLFSTFRVGHASVAEYHRRLAGLDWIGLLEQAMDDSARRFDEDEPPPIRPQLPAARDADLWLAEWLAQKMGMSRHEVERDLIDRPWLDHVAVLDAARDLAVPVPTALAYARRWGGLRASDIPPLPPDAHPDTVTQLFGMAARWDVPLVQLGPVVATLPRRQGPPKEIPAIADDVLRQLWPRNAGFDVTDTFWLAQVPLAFLTDWGLTLADWSGDEIDLGWWLTSVLGLPDATYTDGPGSAMDTDSDVEMTSGSDTDTSSESAAGPNRVFADQMWADLNDHQRERYLTTLSEVAEQLGLDLHRRHELATRLRISTFWVTGLSLRIGQVPDIEEHASRLGVPPDRLFALASVLGVDPAVLDPADDLARLNDADEAGAPRFAMVGPVADSIRSRTDWPTRQLTGTPTDHLYDIVFEQGDVPPRLAQQLNHDGGWLGLRGLLEVAARSDLPTQSLAVYANLSRPPKVPDAGTAGPRRVIGAFQTWRRSDEEKYGLDTSDLWPVWNHDGSATLTRGDVAEVSAAALRYAASDRRAELFRRIIARAARQDVPQSVAGLIRAMGAAAGPGSAPHEWLSPLLPDAPVPDGMSINLLSFLDQHSPEAERAFAHLSDISGVSVGRPTGGQYSLKFTFGHEQAGWTDLAQVLDTLRDLNFTLKKATAEIRTGYGADAAAYLRLAHLYYSHLNALHQIGLASVSSPPPPYGFASVTGFLRAHRKDSGLSFDVAWSSADVVRLRMSSRKELLWPGVRQAGLRIFAELVELARQPFPEPQWWDWPFRPPGDHADDAFDLGLDGWRLVKLLVDGSTRAQAAALLTIFPARRVASKFPMARGLGPVRAAPTIPEALPRTHEVPQGRLLTETLPASVEAYASDWSERWPEPSETVDWLRHRINAGTPPVPYILTQALGGLGDPASGRTFALTIDGAWSDDLPHEPWTWVAPEDRREILVDALAAAESALSVYGGRSRLRTEFDLDEAGRFVIRAADLVDSPPVWRALGSVVEAMRRYGVSVSKMVIEVDHAPLSAAGIGEPVDVAAALGRLVRAHEDALTRLFGSPELPWLNHANPPKVTAAESRPHAVEVGFTYPGIPTSGLGGLQGGVRVVWALLAATTRDPLAASALPDSAADVVGTNFATTRSEPQQVHGWFLDPSGGPQLRSLLAALDLDPAGRAQVAALFHLNSWYPPPDHGHGAVRGMADHPVWPVSTRSEHPAAFVTAVAGLDPEMAARDAVTDSEALRLPLDHLMGIQRRADLYLRTAPPVTDAATELELRQASVAGLWDELERSGATVGAWRERFRNEQVRLGDLGVDVSQHGPIPALVDEAQGVLDTVPAVGGATVEDVIALRAVDSWLTSKTRPWLDAAGESRIDLLRREVADRLDAAAPGPLRPAPTSMEARHGQWAHRGLLGAILDAAVWQGVPLPPEIRTPSHLRDVVTGVVATEPARFADVAGGRGALLAEELPFSTSTALLADFRPAEPTPEQLGRWRAEASAVVRRRLPDADDHTIREAVLAASSARTREHRRSQWRAEFARRVEQPTPTFHARLLRAVMDFDHARVQLTHLASGGATSGARHLQAGIERVDLQLTALGRHLPAVVARALDINIIVHGDQRPVEQTHPGPRPALHLFRTDTDRFRPDTYQAYGPLISADPSSSVPARHADTLDTHLWDFARSWVRERYSILDGGRGWNERRMAWAKLVDLLVKWVDVPPMPTFVDFIDFGDIAIFDPRRWRLDLAVTSVDGALIALMKQLLVAEVITMQARAVSSPPDMSKHTTAHDVARHLWDTRVGEDTRLEAWPSDYAHVRARAATARDSAQREILMTAHRLSTIGPLERSPRLRHRLTQGVLATQRQYADVMASTIDSVAEAQLLLEQKFTEAGSLRDWRTAPTIRVSEVPGFEMVDLGPAGSFVRPAGSRTDPPTRMTHPTRRLDIVEVGDPATAPHVLTQVRDGLPESSTVELVMSAPVSASRAVELAGLVGGDRTLALAANLVDPADLTDHFVAHTRVHTPTLHPFAAYYTVHPEPQRHGLLIADLALVHVGDGRHGLLPGWHIVPMGDRLWIRPADHPEQDLPYSGSARIVIGVPEEETPWTVWVLGQRLGTAVTVGTDLTSEEIVHRLGRLGPKPSVPPLDPAVAHQVGDRDVRLFQRAFENESPLVEADVLVSNEGVAVVERLTLSHVADVLLDLAGADPTESDVEVLVGRLDRLAERQGFHTGDPTQERAANARDRLLSWAGTRLTDAGLAGLLTDVTATDEAEPMTGKPAEPAEAPVAVQRQPVLVPVRAGVYLPHGDDPAPPPVIEWMPRYQSYVSAFATLDPGTAELVAGARRYGPVRFNDQLTAAGVPADARLSLTLSPLTGENVSELSRRTAQRFADELWSLRGAPGIFSTPETSGPAAPPRILPEVLTGWLEQADWPAAQQYLRQHVAELKQRESIEAMRALSHHDPENRVAAPYRAILELVDLAGGVAGPTDARHRPETAMDPDGTQPWLVPTGPVPTAFAFDYLRVRPDRQARRPWNDQLLRMMYEREAFRELAVMLAWGVVERGEHPTQGRHAGFDYGQGNAMVFAAVHRVLRMSVTRAGTPGPTGGWLEIDAVDACELDPLDKAFWVDRMDELRGRVLIFGIPGHPDRNGVPAPEHEKLLNLLIERLASC
ncbi:hypothetical protein [Micromonospora sp. NPDC003816]|uniref:hypothetical protein n=1 Tax=Micromonospora sp. NPDC003816 TaxID=3364224 RepID=UPI0036A45F78